MIDDLHLNAVPAEPDVGSGEPLPGTDEGPGGTGALSAEPEATPGGSSPRRRRYIKRGLLVVAVLLIPVTYSYVRALTGPGNDSLQARTVEWARDNHLGGAVDRIEKYWYAHHQAKVGGTPNSAAGQLRIDSPSPTLANPDATTGTPSIPQATTALVNTPATVGRPAPVDQPATVGQPATTAPTSSPTGGSAPAGSVADTVAPAPSAGPAEVARGPLNPPQPLGSPAPNPLAKEGQWSGIGPQRNGKFGAYGTVIRPDAVHTSVLDAVVWIDPTVLSFRQYPGQKIPGAPWDRPDHVEAQRQADLVAAFEGGFRLGDSKGGMFLGTTMLKPLRSGGATLVIDKNGVPNIGMWGRDFTTTDALDSARQNLDLIVDGGVVVPSLATDANRTWGFTGPANNDAVWRSGAGITADGALVWVGGDGLSIVSLANTLVRAGAVRGMQLDINHEWVQFNTYAAGSGGTVHGRRLLAGMQHSDDRYLSEDTRDFIAVFTRPQ